MEAREGVFPVPSYWGAELFASGLASHGLRIVLLTRPLWAYNQEDANGSEHSGGENSRTADFVRSLYGRSFEFDPSTNVKPNRPFTHRLPAVTLESLGEVTRTILLSCTRSERVQPTPQ